MVDVYPKISGKYLVGGKWKKTSDVKNVINPAEINEVIGEVALCTREDVIKAIDVADKAYKDWSQSSIKSRADRMRKAADELNKVIESHVSLFVRENGKPIVEAKKELLRCVDVMKGGADILSDWWNPKSKGDKNQKVQVRKRPRGVTAIISPWNSPMILTFKRSIPAILAGNTVVIKPATNCPLTVLSAFQIIASFFPEGTINVVTGSGSIIGDVLSHDKRVRTIAFTGSTETGKQIIDMSASTVKQLHLELGGNDPALILPDAKLGDLEMQRITMGILRSAGQVCSAIKRIYVHESRHDELVDKLKREFSKIVVGNGIQPDVTMGPLNNKSQYDYITELLENSKIEGANVDILGEKLDDDSWEEGYFLLPSIVTNINHESELVKAEQFGPTIPIVSYSNLDEAIKMANDTEFGLKASVWTSNELQATNIADRLEAGAVFHNNHTVFKDLNLDFPGIKESGLSRESFCGGLDLFADSYGFAD